jgi:predicted SnoaL-like aldol condensation-catalyzing enzyme
MKTIALVCGWTAVVTALGASPAAGGTLDTFSALEANKRLVKRYYEAARSGHYDEIDRIFALHYIRHNQSELVSPAPPQSALARTLQRHMPDLQANYDVIVAEGDLVAVHWWLQGHPGELPIKIMRMLSGRTGPVIHAGVNIFRVRDGRIVENWNVRDDLALWSQLGLFRIYGLAGFVAGFFVAVIAGRLRVGVQPRWQPFDSVGAIRCGARDPPTSPQTTNEQPGGQLARPPFVRDSWRIVESMATAHQPAERLFLAPGPARQPR